MTDPDTVLRGIEEALKDSSVFTGGSYVTEEPDFDGEHNRLDQPVVSLQVVTNPRATEWDSDLAGFTENQSGEKDGKIFEATWEMQVDIFLTIAAANDDYDVKVIGFDLQNALLLYDNKQEGTTLPDPDADPGTLSDVKSVVVGEGVPENDLAGPGLRRWRQELQVTFVSVRTTSGTPITVVEPPQTSEFEEDANRDAELIWEYSP